MGETGRTKHGLLALNWVPEHCLREHEPEWSHLDLTWRIISNSSACWDTPVTQTVTGALTVLSPIKLPVSWSNGSSEDSSVLADQFPFQFQSPSSDSASTCPLNSQLPTITPGTEQVHPLKDVHWLASLSCGGGAGSRTPLDSVRLNKDCGSAPLTRWRTHVCMSCDIFVARSGTNFQVRQWRGHQHGHMVHASETPTHLTNVIQA